MSETISPEQRIANLARSLVALAERKSHRYQLGEIRTVARQLQELAEAHAAGRLAPLDDGGLPF